MTAAHDPPEALLPTAAVLAAAVADHDREAVA